MVYFLFLFSNTSTFSQVSPLILKPFSICNCHVCHFRNSMEKIFWQLFWQPEWFTTTKIWYHLIILIVYDYKPKILTYENRIEYAYCNVTPKTRKYLVGGVTSFAGGGHLQFDYESEARLMYTHFVIK